MRRLSLASAALTVVLALFTFGVGEGYAAYLHTFDCEGCHRAGTTYTTLEGNNVCLQCHGSPASSYPFNVQGGGTVPKTSVSEFASGDASNAMGTYPTGGSAPTPVAQTSHNWGAPDVNPAAGASAPVNPALTGRTGTSAGRVTCSRCHDPHGDGVTNPQLLRMGANSADAMCLDCHRGWQQIANHGLGTHPINMDYAAIATANPDKFKPAVDNGATVGTIMLMPDGTVSCTSCHGVHAVDSDASTLDDFATAGTGDGLLLKHNGPAKEALATSESICLTCHLQGPHGATGALGCLVCHGGHNDDDANPNYYTLRKEIVVDASQTPDPFDSGQVTIPINYLSDAPTTDYNGVCNACHNNALPVGHLPTWACADCHTHEPGAGGGTGSFSASCGSCHGFPPTVNAPGNTSPGGYAVDASVPANYNTSGVFKDETATPHKAHASGGADYSFSCDKCHGANSNSGTHAGHKNNQFQQALDKGSLPMDALTTGNGQMAPVYTQSGSGSCSAVYCHSNGGKRVNDSTRTYKPAASAPVWAGGAGTITTCNVCHGNDATSMGSVQRDNSAAHAAHLNKGYTCKVCHISTAAGNSALATGAIGGTHVDGTANVGFDTAFNLGAGNLAVGGTPYSSATGTCAVSCHSNGNGGYANVDWDSGVGGAPCGSCHNVTGQTLSGSHSRHVYDTTGPMLACTVCHTNAGSGVDHINGALSYVAGLDTVCNTCHGATSGGSNFDAEPVWTNSNSVSCETCHEGTLAVIGGKTAPNKTNAISTGHLKPSGSYASGNAAAAQQCATCHDTNAVGHFDGISGDDSRLVGGFACTSCHSGYQPHHGKQCYDCHDPHGTSNWYMIYDSQATQNAKDTSGVDEFSGNVVLTARSGGGSFDEVDTNGNLNDICATCHSSTTHNNRADTGTHLDGQTHEGEDCFTCHKPHTDAAPFSGNASTCEGCHSNLATKGAHAAHMTVTPSIDSDLSECVICHEGADQYTVSGSANGLHQNLGVRNTAASINYNSGNGTCATVCHKSSITDGFWTDTALDCNACHYYNANPTLAGNTADADPLSGDHGVHFGAGGVVTCASCHAVPADLSHITAVGGADEGAVLINRGSATQDEATVTATALGSGSDPDAGNPTCNNAACHNPSAGAYIATWNTSVAACTLCHSNTNPGTGSHAPHLNASATFGINTIACTSCHPNHGTNYAHRSGNITFAAGMNYTAGAVDVLGTMGTCTTTTCHNDGNGVAVQTPLWNVASANCSICHTATPASAKHVEHVGNTAFVTGCSDCHTAATATTHINGAKNLDGAKVNYASATQTCTITCHVANTTGDWTLGGALACLDCHAGTYIGGNNVAKGFNAVPATGLHTGTLTVSGNTHDDSFNNGAAGTADCTSCHTATPSTNHINGTFTNSWNAVAPSINFAATVGFTDAATPTCGPNGALAACHDDGGTWKRKWSTTAKNSNGTECANCHGDFTAGFVTGMGARHQTTTSGDAGGQIATNHDGTDKCYTCHTYKSGDATYYNFATQHRNASIELNNAMGFTDNGTTVGCSSCHVATGGTADGGHEFADTTSRWTRALQNGPSADCNTCHASNGRTHADASESATVHDSHVTNGYIAGACTDCHSNAGPGNAAHNNGTVNFGGTYMTSAADYSAAAFGGSCLNTVNGCHDSDLAGDWAGNTLGADSCADCHAATAKLLSQGVYPPTSAEHTAHLNNNTLVPGDCNDCHGANATTGAHTGHVDTFKTTAGQVSLYTVGTGTCTNTCHTVVDGRDWTSATTLNCADCHAAAGKSLYTTYALTGYPPTSAKHTVHINNNAYVAGDCNDCHGANATTGAHTGHQDGVKQNTVSYVSGTQTCTITCHVANTTGDWTAGGSLVCLDCHAGTYIGGGVNGQTSGLHTGTMTISGNTHDDSFNDGNAGTATCVTCHTTSPSSAHINGTFTNTSPTVTITANIGFTDGATPTCGPTAGLVTCHDDGGAWKRKWSTSAKNSNGTECANCHGDFTAGFTTGVVARHQTTTSGDAGGQIAANHDGGDKCYYCHTYKAGDTTYYNFATKHRDGLIQVNGGVGFTDNGTTVGCSNCHSANDGTADGQHAFNEITGTRWTREQLAGFSVDCNSCHLSNGRGHADGTENLTVHDLHVASGFTASCTECHSNNGPGSPDHNNGTVNFGGTYMTSAINYSAAAFGGTCAGVGVNTCHDSDAAGDWSTATLGGDACADCHAATGKLLNQGGYPPTSAEHTAHIGNTALVPNSCADCHGANAATGGHAGHKDMLKTYGNQVTLYTSGTGTCTNNCHNVVDGRDWTSATTLNCADCHAAAGKSLYVSYGLSGYPPVSNEHTLHINNNVLVPNDCNDCHGASATTGAHANHQNGALNTASQVSLYTQANGTCTNTCHVVADGRDWTSATTLNCADCHAATGKSLDQGGYPPVSAKHTKHLNNASYVPNDCTDCHGANATAGTHAGHQNGATDNAVSYAAASQTCTNSCHVASTSGDWTAGGALVCLDCHSGTYIGGGANGQTSGLHTGTLTISGNTHDDSFDDGNLGTATCVSCHTTAPSSSHINGTFTNTTPTITITANVGFLDGATPTCAPTSGLVTCHADGGAWQRKWSTSAKNNNGTECANCHGDFTNGFVTGMAGRHQTTTSGDADGQVATEHDGTDMCYTCHTYKAGDTTYYNFATKHRNGSIEVNSTVGFTDNGTTVGCSGCHVNNDGTADEQHAFADTTARWTRALQAGPPVSCGSCHAYPPTPGDGKAYQASEGKGAHAKHVSHIAARAGVTLNPTSDTFTGTTVTQVCGVCHNNSTIANHTPGGGTRQMQIPSSYQFGVSAPIYNGTVGQPSSVDPKSCSSVSCHFKSTPVWE